MVRVYVLAGAVLLCVLAAGMAIPQGGPPAAESAAAALQAGVGFALPGSAAPEALAGKYPHIAAAGRALHMAANPGQQVKYWSKQDTATSAGAPTTLAGDAPAIEYAGTSIAAAPDGTLYAAWIVQKSAIVVWRKPAGRAWEAAQTVHRTTSFMSYVDIAVDSSGQIFVVWYEGDFYRYARSSSGGSSWSAAGIVSSQKPYKAIAIAGGSNNTVVAAFGAGDGHVYASIWNGESFSTSDLTPFKRVDDFFSFARPAVAPDGTVYVAFTNGPPRPALFYTERKPDGSWPVSRLADGEVYGMVGFNVDSENNLHLGWSSNKSGRWELYYAFKPAAGEWQNPVKATGVGDTYILDVHGAPTIGARAYDHVIFETFDGAGATALRYQQFSGPLDVLGATPLLDGGARMTRNSLVTVGFVDVIGSPDGVRYHWDAPPTDADPWLAFADPLTIAGPPGITENVCGTHVLYTQVRKGSQVEPTPQQGAEIFDTGVQAWVEALNPNMALLPSGAAVGLADSAGQGASDGHPRYTRERQFFLAIDGQADCADLKEFAVAGGAPASMGGSDRYNRRLELPGGAAPGARSFDVQVADQLGNQKTWSFTLTYDPANTDTTGAQPNTAGLPVLGQGGSVSADAANSIIRTLSFQGISVTDNLYGQQEQLPAGRQFWGLWIANAAADVGADSPTLQWFPVRVATPGSSFTVMWDLFSGLGYTSDLANKPGEYYVYVRFLDGAGSPSRHALKAQVTLAPGYTLARYWLPVALRAATAASRD